MKSLLFTVLLLTGTGLVAQSTNCYWTVQGYNCYAVQRPSTNFVNPAQQSWNDLNRRLEEGNREMNERTMIEQQQMWQQNQQAYQNWWNQQQANRPMCTTYSRNAYGQTVARTAPCGY
jgi:hypothetical protein